MVEARKQHCWECLRRRLVCDFQSPGCRRCETSGIDCPGYGSPPPVRVRWLAPGEVSCRRRRVPSARQRTEPVQGATTMHSLVCCATISECQSDPKAYAASTPAMISACPSSRLVDLTMSNMAQSPFEVRVVPTKEEYSRLVDVLWAANFNPYNPVFTAVHPVSGHTPEDRARDKALDAEIRWNMSQANPYSHLIYVIDKATGEVAGGCEWFIFHKNPFPNGPQPVKCTWYPEGTERAEYAECMLSQAFFPRQSWFQRPHAGVNAMGVHPKYRRCGVGRLLMEWGHAIVDPLGYESFIEGSPIGRWLYEEYGYRRVLGLHVDFDKPNPSDEWLRLVHECKPPGILLLWRPPRGEWTEKVPCGPWAVSDLTFKQ